MVIYDRLLGRELNVESDNLNGNYELGRFVFCDGIYKGRDVTKRLFPQTSFSLDESIFKESLETDDLIKFSTTPVEEIVPFLQYSESFLLGEHESDLIQKVGDIKHIVNMPSYKIDREIQKQRVEIAKRISAKSYEYLACHSGDWEYNSVLAFKPKRVLTEILNDNYDIYENQLLVYFIKYVLDQLNARIDKYGSLKEWVNEYSDLFRRYDVSKFSWRKDNRSKEIFKIVYDKYEVEKTNGKNVLTPEGASDPLLNTITEKIETLKKVKKTLEELTNSPLFLSLKRYTLSPVPYHDTNLLMNDKYYRTLRGLWKKWMSENSAINTNNNENEQNIIRGVRQYAFAIILYVIKYNFSWSGEINKKTEPTSCYSILLDGKDSEFRLYMDNHDCINIEIYYKKELESYFRIIVLCEKPGPTITNLKDNEFIIFYGEDTNDEKAVGITLRDVNSIERVGGFLRMLLIKNLYEVRISRTYRLETYQRLVNYGDLIPKGCVKIAPNGEYIYCKYPNEEFKFDEVRFDRHSSAIRLPGDTKENRKKEVRELFDALKSNTKDFRDSLMCPCCGGKLKGTDFELLTCTECSSSIKRNGNNYIELFPKDADSVKDPRGYYGMDYVKIIL